MDYSIKSVEEKRTEEGFVGQSHDRKSAETKAEEGKRAMQI